jgi:cytoskeletal protein CcmA (bactofilin family)
MSDKGDKKTFVEEGTQFKGTMTSSCAVVVRGVVEGDLAAPSLVISDTGAVRGKVKADELTSLGEIAGEFDADVVNLSGRVQDATIIRAKSLEVRLATEEGKMQVVFGEARLEVGDPPKEPVNPAPAKKKGKADGDEA